MKNILKMIAREILLPAALTAINDLIAKKFASKDKPATDKPTA